MGRDAEVAERAGDARRAHQVDLDGQVEGRVEAHRRGRVDHHVTRREHGPSLVGEAQAVGADITFDHLHPACDRLVERGLAAELGAEPVEAVVLEDLPRGPLLDRAHPSGPDQQDQLAVGDRTQEPFDECRAEKAGRTGDGYAL